MSDKNLVEATKPAGLTNAERQAKYRAKFAAAGLTEVRGIYLPPELHEELKRAAVKLLTALR